MSQLPHEQLLQLIWNLAMQQPPLYEALARHCAGQPMEREPVAAAQLRQQIDQVFAYLATVSAYDYEDDYDDEYEYEEITALLQQVGAKERRERPELLWYLIERANLAFAEATLATVQIELAIAQYVQLVSELCPSLPERKPHIEKLVSSLDWELMGHGRILVTTRRGLETLAGYPLLIDLLKGHPAQSIREWVAHYYRQLGRDDAYLTYRRAHLHHEFQYLDLAQFWQQRGDTRQYLATLESWLTLGVPPEPPSVVLQMLEAHYAQQQNQVELLRILLCEAQWYGVTLALYQRIKPLAIAQEQWQEVRHQLLSLAKGGAEIETLSRIYIYEAQEEDAIALLDHPQCYESTTVFIADGIKQKYPQQAIVIYKKLIQAYLDRKNREGYAIAAEYAQALKHIYLNILNSPEPWRDYLLQLKERYGQKRSFCDEFKDL
ncbi:MAG: hypothetical protein HC919_01125 [Oscillatoriales cyanobacterium SM2_2_1]|nr:hypothetical protein [Oscillatoriales cyanobacterium SM2_2_1]